MSVVGGIEAGGTTWVCAVGTGPDDLQAEATVPTSGPDETLARAVEFFEREGPVEALGVGCFGPVDLIRGAIAATPKQGWSHTEVATPLRERLGVPVVFDTDVNAAALGEHRWGAAQGLDTFAYVTVGTGIGGGAMAGAKLLHGLGHPEMGRVRIPHDFAFDPFPGSCPFHGDCWEGLASAPALAARWGRPPEQLDDDAPWALEARYLALGLVAVIAVLSPQRIVLGGGVLRRAGLLELVRDEIDGLLSGYVPAPELVPPAARRAVRSPRRARARRDPGVRRMSADQARRRDLHPPAVRLSDVWLSSGSRSSSSAPRFRPPSARSRRTARPPSG